MHVLYSANNILHVSAPYAHPEIPSAIPQPYQVLGGPSGGDPCGISPTNRRVQAEEWIIHM